eukprot:2670725-Lingulodinium_polyedra.AAC.1
MDLTVAVAPIYCWAAGRVSAKLKYGVRKALASARYRKATQSQLKQGVAARAQLASQGVLPASGVPVAKKAILYTWGRGVAEPPGM